MAGKKTQKSQEPGESVLTLLKGLDQLKDAFTVWCEDELDGMELSLDISTFVAFTNDMDSADEIKKFVEVYYGKSEKIRQFGEKFVDKRSHYRAQRDGQNSEEQNEPKEDEQPKGKEQLI